MFLGVRHYIILQRISILVLIFIDENLIFSLTIWNNSHWFLKADTISKTSIHRYTSYVWLCWLVALKFWELEWKNKIPNILTLKSYSRLHTYKKSLRSRISNELDHWNVFTSKMLSELTDKEASLEEIDLIGL